MINKCSNYLTGITDAHQALYDQEELATKLYCASNRVDQQQLRKVFIKFANDNPQDLHFAAGGIVMNAFIEAFPCK